MKLFPSSHISTGIIPSLLKIAKITKKQRNKQTNKTNTPTNKLIKENIELVKIKRIIREH